MSLKKVTDIFKHCLADYIYDGAWESCNCQYHKEPISKAYKNKMDTL